MILESYNKLKDSMNEKIEQLFNEWANGVSDLIEAGLDRPLLTRDQVSMLAVNFDPELYAIIKEVQYLKKIGRTDVPKKALEVYIKMLKYFII